jgi:hypothetical protein
MNIGALQNRFFKLSFLQERMSNQDFRNLCFAPTTIKATVFVALLNLPTELIAHILWYLDLVDLQSCQLVHSSLRSEIKDSVSLKYLKDLKASGVEDNRFYTRRTTSERLDMLLHRENVWSHLEVDFIQSVRNKHRSK